MLTGRVHVGRRERWVVLPCPLGGHHDGSSGLLASQLRGDPDHSRRNDPRMGMFVRKGDRVELEHTSAQGAKASLVMRPADLGAVWEVRKATHGCAVFE